MGANKVVQKSKEAKMKAAMAGGKSRKKKWAKGKARYGFYSHTYTIYIRTP